MIGNERKKHSLLRPLKILGNHSKLRSKCHARARKEHEMLCRCPSANRIFPDPHFVKHFIICTPSNPHKKTRKLNFLTSPYSNHFVYYKWFLAVSFQPKVTCGCPKGGSFQPKFWLMGSSCESGQLPVFPFKLSGNLVNWDVQGTMAWIIPVPSSTQYVKN